MEYIVSSFQLTLGTYLSFERESNYNENRLSLREKEQCD